MFVKFFCLISFLGFQFSIYKAEAQIKVSKADLSQIVQNMSGTFSGEAQSKSD